MVKLKKTIIIVLVFFLIMLIILCLKYHKKKYFFTDPFTYDKMKNPIKIINKKEKKIKSLNIREGTGLGKDFNVYFNILDGGEFMKSSNDSHLIIQNENIIAIEHIPSNNNKTGYIFIPNQELINETDEKLLLTPNKVRIVLCKSKYAKIIFNNFKINYNCLWTVYDFIFPPVLTTVFYNYPKDRNVFLHPAGKSHMKNTEKIVESWYKNPEWPLLIITCSTRCLSIHSNIINIISKCKNVKLYTFLSKQNFNLLQKYSGYVILPSSCEGFCHSAYEAIENGNLLITSDIPPLNEKLKNNYNCLMIKPNSFVTLGEYDSEINWINKLSCKAGLSGSYCVTISIEDIENIVNKSISLSSEQYDQIKLNGIQDLYTMIIDGNHSIKEAFKTSGLITKSD